MQTKSDAREQAESGLKFLGLVIFENRLKPGTTPAIQALRSAHLACRMITGDNPLTAVSVARECSLINQAAHVFLPVFSRGLYSRRRHRRRFNDIDVFDTGPRKRIYRCFQACMVMYG